MNASLHRIYTAIVIILPALVCGCGPEDIMPAPLCSYLPEPAVQPGVPRPQRAPLTWEAALRKCEGEKFVAADYDAKGYRIVATTQKPSGQIMDWMAAESVPGSERPTPPPIVDDHPLPPGVELGKTELELYPELRGPKGTVGIPRMTFPAYVSGESGASSLEEYLQESEKSEKRRAPTGKERLYAGYRLKTVNLGAFGTVDAFAGPEIEDWTFSVMEMAVQCIDPASGKTETIGIAASRDRRNFRKSHQDSQLYLQVEHYIEDPNEGDPKLRIKGGWVGGDETEEAFEWVTNHQYHPNEPIPASTAFGGQHYEHRFGIELWQGEWWLSYQGEWFGSYPSTLFTQLRSYACEVSWYMEVFDPTPDTWTYTDGGSGEFAEYYYPFAAYFKRLFYMDHQGWYQWLLKNAAWAVLPYNPACYTATPMEFTWKPGAENGFYCGGPGNDPIKAPYCKSFQ